MCDNTYSWRSFNEDLTGVKTRVEKASITQKQRHLLEELQNTELTKVERAIIIEELRTLRVDGHVISKENIK